MKVSASAGRAQAPFQHEGVTALVQQGCRSHGRPQHRDVVGDRGWRRGLETVAPRPLEL